MALFKTILIHNSSIRAKHISQNYSQTYISHDCVYHVLITEGKHTARRHKINLKKHIDVNYKG